jgi:hypothetical protein
MSHTASQRVRDALFMVALFGSVGVASAQGPAPNSDNGAPKGQPAQPADQPAKPTRVPGGDGVEEPSVKQAPPPAVHTVIFINGTLDVPDAPKDTATTPSQFSATNAARDNLPIMARGPALTDSQRKLILDRVTSNDTGNAGARAARDAGAAARVYAGPSTILPSSVEMQAWPADVVRAIPDIRDTKFVTLEKKILVVRPENWIVIEEIER